MKRNILSIFVFTAIFTYTTNTRAQVGIGTSSPGASAQLEVSSTTKGFLPPRMTSTQRAAISSPSAGLMVYQTDATAGLYYFDGSSWLYIVNSESNILPVINGGTGVNTSTGAGSVVLSTSPTLTTPTISSGSVQFPNSLYILPTTHATSKRASLRLDEWLLYQDISADGTKNFTITERDGGNFTSRFFINVGGNIGIGNITPNARLDIRTSPTSTTNPGEGYLGLGTTSTAANTAGAGAVRYNTSGALEFSNGTSWIAVTTPSFGDIKTGIQASDHNGWIRLNGRAKTTLTASQQAQATALGIGANLPDATDAYLVQNGATLGSVSGSNQRTITQANLPLYNLPAATTSSSGSHSHTVDPAAVNTNTTGSHSHTGTVGGHNWNGGGAYAGGFDAGGFALYNPTLTINSAGDHAHSVDIPSTTSSTDGAHTHSVTVSSGGSGTAITINPRSLSVNTFIYLGN